MDINDILIKSIEDNCGFDAYRKTVVLREIDVSTNEDYQRNFTYYYRVRRNAEWRQNLFRFIEINKNSVNISFEDILGELKSYEGKMEASFASKVLATINVDKPIWDSNVLKALGESIDSKDINDYVKEYDVICAKVNDFIDSDKGKEYIEWFDSVFKNCTDFSKVKKVDYLLWSMGKGDYKLNQFL